MEKLTDKQIKFCEEYLVDLNATQAAIRAGYSERSARQIASDMLTKHDIQDYIAERQAALTEKTLITTEWVVKRLKEISDRCMQSEPVMIRTENGMIESGEYKFDSSGANKATELLGRHIGIFEKDNKQKAAPADMSKLSDEDLLKLAELQNKIGDK